MSRFVHTFLAWLPLGIAVTGLCILVYGTVQQNYRQSLNDPQIQMAEDAAAGLSASVSPEKLVANPDSIDVASSLVPWLAIYNADGVSLISSGQLNGEIPSVPQGVLQAAHNSVGKDTVQPYENRVTWQFGAGVRQAIVVVYVPSRDLYVVAGRNMREVEDREQRLGGMVGLAWLALIVITFAVAVIANHVKRKL